MPYNVKVPGAQCDNVGEAQGYMPISIKYEKQEIQTADGVDVHPVMTTHWKFTDAEIYELLAGSVLVLNILGDTWPPVLLQIPAIKSQGNG